MRWHIGFYISLGYTSACCKNNSSFEQQICDRIEESPKYQFSNGNDNFRPAATLNYRIVDMESHHLIVSFLPSFLTPSSISFPPDLARNKSNRLVEPVKYFLARETDILEISIEISVSNGFIQTVIFFLWN